MAKQLNTTKTRSKSICGLPPGALGMKHAPIKGFSESVNPDLLESLGAEEIQRQELIYEFIGLEKQYLQELNKINEVIIKPITAANLLNKTELNLLFSNFASILTVHQGLSEEFDKILKEGAVIKKFGEALVKQADVFASYLVYASNFPLAKSAFEQFKEKYPAFADLVQKITSKDLQGLTIISCLGFLVSRVLRYPETLSIILNHTPPDHSDHKDLMDAYTRIKDNVDMTSQGNNSQQMSELQRRLDPNGELDLVSANRKFVREGPAQVVIKNKKKIDAEIVACNDMILFTKKKKGVPKIFKAINLASCELIKQPTVEGTVNETALELRESANDYSIIYLASVEEMESWVLDLEPYVDLSKGLGTDAPKVLIAEKGKKIYGIKSMTRALVPGVFKKKDPAAVPVAKAEQENADDTQGETGEADKLLAGSDDRVVRQITIPRNLPLGMEMEIKHLSAKLQKRLMKCNELKKQVAVITERKKNQEKELELVQKSEKHAQIRSVADDLLTGQALLCYELQQLRWFTAQLNRATREKAIVEKDLEKIRQKLEKKHDESKPKKLNEEDVTKLLVNMVAFETEKAKLCEIEKNRLAESCTASLKVVQHEHTKCLKERDTSIEDMQKLRLDLQVQSDRTKSLQQENQLLRERLAEIETTMSKLSVEELKQMREALKKAIENDELDEEPEDAEVAGRKDTLTSSSSEPKSISVVDERRLVGGSGINKKSASSDAVGIEKKQKAASLPKRHAVTKEDLTTPNS